MRGANREPRAESVDHRGILGRFRSRERERERVSLLDCRYVVNMSSSEWKWTISIVECACTIHMGMGSDDRIELMTEPLKVNATMRRE